MVAYEIEFQMSLWQGDYEAALDCAERVLGGLTEPPLRGYRALWHYLAGSAAWLGASDGVTTLAAKAREQFAHAKKAASGIPWLVALARYHTVAPSLMEDNTVLLGQIERLEAVLARLGTTHDRSFAKREKEILDGLASKETFEQAQKLLGELLGFDADKKEVDGSPDPWWIATDLCIVFEDYVGAEDAGPFNVSGLIPIRANADHGCAAKRRQAAAIFVSPAGRISPWWCGETRPSPGGCGRSARGSEPHRT